MSGRDELLHFLIRYGGNCRDCADENGFCPRTGIGCGERRKACEFILGALEYGTEHNFAAGYRLVAPGQLDNETLEAAAKVAEDECRAHNTGSGFDSQPAYAASYRIAATIRSMKEKG